MQIYDKDNGITYFCNRGRVARWKKKNLEDEKWGEIRDQDGSYTYHGSWMLYGRGGCK